MIPYRDRDSTVAHSADLGLFGRASRSLRHRTPTHGIRAFQHISPLESLAESTDSAAFSSGDLHRNSRTPSAAALWRRLLEDRPRRAHSDGENRATDFLERFAIARFAGDESSRGSASENPRGARRLSQRFEAFLASLSSPTRSSSRGWRPPRPSRPETRPCRDRSSAPGEHRVG